MTRMQSVYYCTKERLLDQEEFHTAVRSAYSHLTDVFTCTSCLELLKTKLGSKCPRIIRVYSEMLENQAFPIPRDSLQIGGNQKGRRYEMIDKDEQRDICLHHLIRKESNKFAKKIREFDKLFKANRDTPENVTDEQVSFYLSLYGRIRKLSVGKWSSEQSPGGSFGSKPPESWTFCMPVNFACNFVH